MNGRLDLLVNIGAARKTDTEVKDGQASDDIARLLALSVQLTLPRDCESRRE
jgi:hypothetical protein